ncbi:ATP-binding protein [Streptomyces pathocidini]|uniref:ATP-binding protein n=1 Tax=Streptomyces pathocidini TaxID=1650571 RepID=A0ABW7UJP1_9ACTN|nr:ATP-binding protein [Streptomyces pathocidini]
MTKPDQQAALLWTMAFTSTPECVALVRQHTGEVLAERGYHPDDIDGALLVCSELATNAVRHGHRDGHPFEVRLAAEGKHFLVEVSDVSSHPPCELMEGSDSEHGRGLQLVAALAEDFGHHSRSPLGKTVWARLLLADPQRREHDHA